MSVVSGLAVELVGGPECGRTTIDNDVAPPRLSFDSKNWPDDFEHVYLLEDRPRKIPTYLYEGCFPK